MPWKFRRTFKPLELIASRQQPALDVGGSLLVMDFADDEGLCGSEDFFAALQDGRFGTFDINLDQAGQGVLPSNSIQSDGLDFDCGYFGGRVFQKNAPIHTGLKIS